MKGVSGGLMWTIAALVIGGLAAAFFFLIITGYGKEIVGMFSSFINAGGQLVCTIMGRIPLIGIFSGC
jgi:hypothetical protein